MTSVAQRTQPAAPTPKKRSKVVDYLTTTDHKKIGVMYLFFSFFAFLVGGSLALGIRTQLASPGGTFIKDLDTYNQFFTMHATAMLFFFIIPIWAGWGNYIVPLQIGALDMAFPRINALSFWLLPAGFVTMFSGYLVGGGPAAAGWTEYPPLTSLKFMPGHGTDLWIVGLLLVGVSSMLGAINFMVTIFKMRAPGMTMFRMPVFTWNILVTSILSLLALPVLTSALIMLFIDRNYGGSFFDPSVGGNAILWQNLFWFYSHPAVYIMILPSFGLISEVLPVFSRKPLFGYKAFVFATAGIGALGFSVWAHHMFTTGAVLLPFFAVMTAFIAVPTGVKFFNWIATLWQGKLTFETPMLFALGFLTMFLIGGINGMFAAQPPIDYAIHDTYWIVSHIHYVLFGGSVFGVYAAMYFWYPKITGRMMDDKLGKIHFWMTFVGFNLAFFPMHMLGLDGMPRRIANYAAHPEWATWNKVSTFGAFLIGISVLPFLYNVWKSRRGPVAGDDPWKGNSLEWWTSSPPPVHNFDSLPPIRSERPVFDARLAREAEARLTAEGGTA